MNILINASEIKQGGGIQVTDSICRSIKDYPNHNFFIVLSEYFGEIDKAYVKANNIWVFRYNLNKYNINF